jgi:CheY-like chemotaxis protein
MKSMLSFPKVVVVVDDEPETTEMIAEMVRLSGCQAIPTFGGTLAMNLIAREKPDVVVLDVMMPDLSGYDVLRFIRKDPRLKHIPVILVSARSRPEDIQEGLNAGAEVYLTKPVAFAELQQAVRKVTAN